MFAVLYNCTYSQTCRNPCSTLFVRLWSVTTTAMSKTKVFFDMDVGGKAVGRMIFEVN